MALRRNIEKLTGQSVGYETSARIFKKIGLGQPLSSLEMDTKSQILLLLGQVSSRPSPPPPPSVSSFPRY